MVRWRVHTLNEIHDLMVTRQQLYRCTRAPLQISFFIHNAALALYGIFK
jgi:hypothetical protein